MIDIGSVLTWFVNMIVIHYVNPCTAVFFDEIIKFIEFCKMSTKTVIIDESP